MPSVIDPADLAACRAMLRGGSRSFFAAGLLLPRRVLEPTTALYAFCRVADDLIDGPAGGPRALETLHRRLDAIYAGAPGPDAADRALAAVVASHRLPRALLDGLLEGFAWDAEGRQYEDLAAVQAYAARVAGTVGAMMAVLMGARAPDVVARACDLGIAMQLSNIARDVGEDARAGRLYLPRFWLREAGIDPDAFLAAPCFTPALGAVIRRLVAAARRPLRPRRRRASPPSRSTAGPASAPPAASTPPSGTRSQHAAATPSTPAPSCRSRGNSRCSAAPSAPPHARAGPSPTRPSPPPATWSPPWPPARRLRRRRAVWSGSSNCSPNWNNGRASHPPGAADRNPENGRLSPWAATSGSSFCWGSWAC